MPDPATYNYTCITNLQIFFDVSGLGSLLWVWYGAEILSLCHYDITIVAHIYLVHLYFEVLGVNCFDLQKIL